MSRFAPLAIAVVAATAASNAGPSGAARGFPALPAAGASAALVRASDDQPSDHRRHPNGGYHVNRMGYGNYTSGANGGFGGYPAGSAGAQILQEQQRRKCQDVPETCCTVNRRRGTAR